MKNLNNLTGYFQTGCGFNNESRYDFKIRNYNSTSPSAQVEVIFDNITERLVSLIQQYDIAVGCVAWLTNFEILEELSRKDWTNLVVQKEDFLRNDSSKNDTDWQARLRQAYGKLSGKDFSMNVPELYIDHPHFNRTVQQCCVRADGAWSHFRETVRCIGYSNYGRNITPKMHHKFLVLGHSDSGVDFVPELVWTGSFNFTQNAESSRENAVIIRDKKICHAYLSEWAQLWALSEPLDWTSAEPEKPELYVGT
ncbi:hypothetical protein INT50_08980 [Vibrio diabolicus]|uniref:phospholipase D-like domain-containing protein n=1 Tax=Vibrio diabolicus TaxID=50719 RepID=UPI0013DF0934|nr:phospholipase D-like domain-containing protein [Vibrio diabolicus]QOV28815.1 hypothetical protein INT50_08980 [Vibrio diabolicus]